MYIPFWLLSQLIIINSPLKIASVHTQNSLSFFFFCHLNYSAFHVAQSCHDWNNQCPGKYREKIYKHLNDFIIFLKKKIEIFFFFFHLILFYSLRYLLIDFIHNVYVICWYIFINGCDDVDGRMNIVVHAWSFGSLVFVPKRHINRQLTRRILYILYIYR